MDIESQQFFELVTDALRAGPGSPQWHQAVTLLREKQGDSDDYALLYQAREHLESGRKYREVKAGPGFTRKVMEAVERHAPRPQRVSTASVVAAVSAIVLIAVLGLSAWVIFASRGHTTVDELGKVILTENLASTNFDESIGPQWKMEGMLTFAPDQGLRAKGEGTGAIVLASPLGSEDRFGAEMTVRVAEGAGGVIVQLFVMDTAGHELVWLVQGERAKVVTADGKVMAESKIDPGATVTVSLKVDRDVAVVDAGGQRVWGGENRLSAGTPRYVGVRFVRRAGSTGEGPVVQSLRVARARMP